MKSVYTLTIVTLEKHSGVYVQVCLRAPLDFPTWVPGQFLSLRRTINGSQTIRSYSITTLPEESLLILVKREANGAFSRWLADYAQPGDTVESLAPAGNFTLPENRQPIDHLFLFGAGSGIAPIRALTLQALRNGCARSTHLLYSAQSREEAPFLNEFEGLVSDGLDFQPFLSRLPDGKADRLTNLRLEDYILHLQIKPHQNNLFFICGPISYRRMVRFTLRTMDIPASQIREENFDPQTGTQSLRPLLKQDALIRVEWPDGSETTFTCQPAEAILAAALRQGVELPYSCRGGVCAKCVAQLMEGKTQVTLNEILSPIDLANGLTLTCTAYPASEVVRLRFGATL